MKGIEYFEKKIEDSYPQHIDIGELEVRQVVALEMIALQLCRINKREHDREKLNKVEIVYKGGNDG